MCSFWGALDILWELMGDGTLFVNDAVLGKTVLK